MPHTMSSSPAATRSSRSDGVTSWSSSETVRPVFVLDGSANFLQQTDRKALEPAGCHLPGEGRRTRPGAGAHDAIGLDPGQHAVRGGECRRREARQGRHQQGQGKRKGKRGSHVPERRPTARCGEAQMIANAGHSSPEAMPPMPQAAAHARRRQGPVDFARHDTLFHRTAILDMVLSLLRSAAPLWPRGGPACQSGFIPLFGFAKPGCGDELRNDHRRPIRCDRSVLPSRPGRRCRRANGVMRDLVPTSSFFFPPGGCRRWRPRHRPR